MFYYFNYFEELIKSGSLFWFSALAGTGLFIIQFIINMLGGAEPDGFESTEFEGAEYADGATDSGDIRKFKWFSIQSITGFLMMFGWTAITCQDQFDLDNLTTLTLSIGSGLFSAFIIRTIFKFAKKLQSPGTSYKIEDAIGKEAYVYQAIPENGTGKVSLSLHDLTHEINAVSEDSQKMPSFARVQIIQKKDDNTVVVKLI